jgi:hypothetical protein
MSQPVTTTASQSEGVTITPQHPHLDNLSSSFGAPVTIRGADHDRASLIARAKSAGSMARRTYLAAAVIFGGCTGLIYAATLVPLILPEVPLGDAPALTALAYTIVVISFAVLFTPLFAWLVIPTLTFLGLMGRRVAILCWTGQAMYLVAIVAAFPPAFPMISLPAAIIAMVALPRIRGVAWFVTPITLAGSIVIFGVILMSAPPSLSTPGMRVLIKPEARVILGIGLCAIALAVAIRVWLILRRYARKELSDSTLLITQWWFIEAVTLSLVPLFYSPWGVLACFGAFLTLFFIISRRLRRLQAMALRNPPASLLLLRTFGDQRRSSRFLADVGSHWRWIGSIQVIAAGDIAAATLDPHEFLDYVRRRLDSHFVRTVDDLPVRLAALDYSPDRDGRYRINDLFCRGDTWRLALLHLIDSSAVVLIDLRGFTSEHVGVTYELEQLAALSRLDRVVAVVDDTTSLSTLREALDRAAGPNMVRLEPSGQVEANGVQLLHVGSARRVSASELFNLLCRTAARDARRPEQS